MRARRDTTAQAEGAAQTDAAVLLQYYNERDYITSPEGVMKLVSIVVCAALTAVLLTSSCADAPLSAAGAALELASAATLAGLCAVRLLQLVAYAPVGYLLADLILSTVIGILLLVTAVLSLTLCDKMRVSDYIHGLLGIANAGIVTASAVITYVSVTRRWDAARRRVALPPRAPPEQDV